MVSEQEQVIPMSYPQLSALINRAAGRLIADLPKIGKQCVITSPEWEKAGMRVPPNATFMLTIGKP